MPIPLFSDLRPLFGRDRCDRAMERLTKVDRLCFAAALEGNAVNVSAYLRRGADVSSLNATRLLPIVAGKGHVEVLRVLMQAGADMEASTPQEFTPLTTAARKGKTEVVRLLLNENIGSRVSREKALQIASIWGHPDIVRLLLEHGVNPNAQSEHGGTALMQAARRNHIQIIHLLIEGEAEVNLVDRSNMTSLSYARRFRHAEAVALLTQAGGIERPLSLADRLRNRWVGPLRKIMEPVNKRIEK